MGVEKDRKYKYGYCSTSTFFALRTVLVLFSEKVRFFNSL